MIKWIDKKSVLGSGNKVFKAGDVIPAGLLTPVRIEELKKQGKIIETSGQMQSVKAEPETEVKRGRKPKQIETGEIIDDND